MRPLRFVALSADGQAMILTDEVGRMLSLAIDDQVIAAVQRERTGTPGQLSMDVEATLTPRDIQSRIRSGESAEHVARLANVPMEKVLRFAGPVLQERAAMAQLARRTRLRGADSGQTLADVVDGRLRAHGVDVETVAWDSYRRDDGGWRTTATWPSGKATAHAIWDLDRARSMVTPVDEMANFLSGEQDLLIAPDEQMLPFGVRAGQLPDDADPKEGPVVPALSMLRRRDERRRDEPAAAAAAAEAAAASAPAREVPRELPREGRGDLRQAARESGRGRALDPRFDDLRAPRRPDTHPGLAGGPGLSGPGGPGHGGPGHGGPGMPAAGGPGPSLPAAGMPGTGMPGSGMPGSGMPGSGMPGTGVPGNGLPGTGVPGNGMPGTGMPGTGMPGTEMPGTGMPGTGMPGSGAPGTGMPGTGIPGTGMPGTGVPGAGMPRPGVSPGSLIPSRPGIPSRSSGLLGPSGPHGPSGSDDPAAASGRDGLRGAGRLDDPRPAAGGQRADRSDEVRRPDPWGDDPRRPAGRRGDVPTPGEAAPTSGGGITGRNDWRERLDPTGVGTPPSGNSGRPEPPKAGSGRGRKAELPSWDDILFGSGAARSDRR
ncbi:septation protein SepH [Cryptosporangium sp. NPDC051539]|uniref:septation protein SepH n=1 Tax=Cryptosporangium sp. NPDC051539 TaxID=3363962 RepID=UPI0037926EF7